MDYGNSEGDQEGAVAVFILLLIVNIKILIINITAVMMIMMMMMIILSVSSPSHKGDQEGAEAVLVTVVRRQLLIMTPVPQSMLACHIIINTNFEYFGDLFADLMYLVLLITKSIDLIL